MQATNGILPRLWLAGIPLIWPAILAAQTVTITEYPTPTTATSQPSGITLGPDGALWFTETAGNKIGRLATSGVFTEYAIPTAGRFPGSITAGSDGALWFIELSDSGYIGRITTAGVITEYLLPSQLRSLNGITAGPDGALWVTATGLYNGIGRITTAGAATIYPLTG